MEFGVGNKTFFSLTVFMNSSLMQWFFVTM